MSFAIRITLGAAGGAAGGYALSRLLCIGGGCPLTSNRPLMMVVGAGLGLWFALGGCASRPAAQQPQAHAAEELASSEEFKARVIDPGKPAVVDFYADWCRPCKLLAPILEDLARQYEGRVAFYRVDVDSLVDLAGQQRIRALPTLVFFRGGAPVDRVEGLLDKSALAQRLENLLSGSG